MKFRDSRSPLTWLWQASKLPRPIMSSRCGQNTRATLSRASSRSLLSNRLNRASGRGVMGSGNISAPDTVVGKHAFA
jgi:hypothetical protein